MTSRSTATESTESAEPGRQDFEVRYSETTHWVVEIVASDPAEAWEIWRDKKHELMEEAVEVDSSGWRDVTLERAKGGRS